MAKQGLRPAPVYVATFADGTVGRCSFWSQAGKPIDVAAGRRTAAALWSRPEGAPYSGTYPPAVIIAGHVEHAALAAPIIDSLGADTPARKRANWSAIAAAARQALERGDAAEALRLLAA